MCVISFTHQILQSTLIFQWLNKLQSARITIANFDGSLIDVEFTADKPQVSTPWK